MSVGQSIFIFIGPPGAGKGTLAHRCINRQGWIQCSTGDLCRSIIAQDTPLARQIDLLLKSGKLISDSLIIEMVDQWLNEHLTRGVPVILDGFPRTIVQAEQLALLLAKPAFAHLSVSVIKMELDNEQLVERLLGRRMCSNSSCNAVYSVATLGEESTCKACISPLMQRSDDVEHVIRERLATYRTHAEKLITYYKSAGNKIITLDVMCPSEQVYDQFMSLI